MRRFFSLTIAILLTVFLLSGCQTATQKRMEAISTGVHSVNKALKVNRLDLAVKYSDQLTKIVPTPKKVINIKPVIKKDVNGKEVKYAVLPSGFDLNIKPLVVDSPEYTKFVLEDPTVKKQLENDNKLFGNFETQVDKAVNATIKESESIPKKKFPWLGMFSGLGVVGVIALCIFAPAFIPVIIQIFRTLSEFIADLFVYVLSLFKKK